MGPSGRRAALCSMSYHLVECHHPLTWLLLSISFSVGRTIPEGVHQGERESTITISTVCSSGPGEKVTVNTRLPMHMNGYNEQLYNWKEQMKQRSLTHSFSP